jgi:hypothetical protein
MHEFFLTLTLCHTVHATEEEDNNAPYPYHYQVSYVLLQALKYNKCFLLAQQRFVTTVLVTVVCAN